jgi:Tol biopolymer transport system component
MTTNGNQVKRLTYKGGFAPRVAINDNWLYYTKDRYQTRLWKVAIDGGEEQMVLDNNLEDFGAWSVTKDGIFFIECIENHHVLNKLSFKSGQIEKVVDLSEKDCMAPVVSPDGRYLFYSQADYEIADILFVENFK